MIKILHIITNLRKGGAERMTIDIAQELSNKDNITVQLILFENKIEYDISDIQNLVQIIPSSVQLSLTKPNRYNTRNLQKAIEDYHPDIIHTHLFEAELVSRFCNYPQAKWFSHCHDNMIQFEHFTLNTLFNKKQLTNYYEKRLLFKQYKKNNGTQFIAISNDTKEYFKERVQPYNVSLLHNAISFDRFYQLLPKTRNTTLKLINIGSFQDKKNQSFLIDVAQKLKQAAIQFEMHLLGDGKNRKIIEKNIKASELEDSIFLHGNVDHVENFLLQSDIYIHSATYEPLGLVLIEAMAAGLPVITLDGKGNRDLIVQKKNGYMIFNKSPQTFCNTIINLWNDEKRYHEVSYNAQEYARQFDIKGYCSILLQLYSDNKSYH